MFETAKIDGVCPPPTKFVILFRSAPCSASIVNSIFSGGYALQRDMIV